LLSADTYPTLYKAIPALEYLQTEWEKLQQKYEMEPGISEVLQAGLDKLAIYYLKMEASDAYGNAMSEFSWFICLISLTCGSFDTIHQDAVPREVVERAFTFKSYKYTSAGSKGRILTEGVPPKRTSVQMLTVGRQFEQSYSRQTHEPVKESHAASSVWGDMWDDTGDVEGLKNEAERYLAEPPTPHPAKGGLDALVYWQVSAWFLVLLFTLNTINLSQSVQHIYPQLSKMAIDYLAIQGSATPVERVWSSAADTDTKKRNRLSSERLAALQLLKAVYRKRRAKRMSAEDRKKWQEERMRRINEQDWQDDTHNYAEILFPDIELDIM
jgi:hypothetical protein